MNYLIKILLIALLFTSCKKDWLEAKPKQSLSTIGSVADLESLLENTTVYYSYLGELGSDDYYTTSAGFQSFSLLERNIYTWAAGSDFYAGTELLYDWDYVYNFLFTANTVIESADKIKPTEQEMTRLEHAKGRAYFFRAWYHYHLAQLFCKPYSQSTANTDMGIILRLESDINLPSKRATVEATYKSIIDDLKTSQSLMPAMPTYTNQPSALAAYALLARVYLLMGNYPAALENADLCLNIKNELLDYNTVDPNAEGPFPANSQEVILWGDMVFTTSLPSPYGVSFVDTTLYSMYEEDDLRKKIFFVNSNGGIQYKGSYASYFYVPFTGLALDEVYLIKAECLARNGNIVESLETLNTLLQKRWDNTKPFIPFATADKEILIRKVLDERRKELCFRGLRWSDLRRLNMDDKYKVTLTRELDGDNTIYTLPPNDHRYVYPFPENELKYSGVEQNER